MKKHEEKQLDAIMYMRDLLSRKKTLYVCLVVFLLIFAALGYQRNVASRAATAALNKQRAALLTPTPALPLPSAGKKFVELDLKGTYQCMSFSQQTATLSASLSGGQAYVEKMTPQGSAHMVFDGDCGYIWNSKNTGQKTCGLSRVFDSLGMLSFVGGGFDYRSIVGSVTAPARSILEALETPESAIPSEAETDGLLDACRPAATVDTSLFTVPANIAFEEIEMEQQEQ